MKVSNRLYVFGIVLLIGIVLARFGIISSTNYETSFLGLVILLSSGSICESIEKLKEEVKRK